MSIRGEAYYQLPAGELAAWIERQGADTWWTVDGDPILTGRLSFPCPGDELSDELRRINRTLLVRDTQERSEAAGQAVDRNALDAMVDRLGKHASVGAGPQPAWTSDRFLHLCWEGSDQEWLLVEDRETTESSRNDLAVRGNE